MIALRLGLPRSLLFSFGQLLIASCQLNSFQLLLAMFPLKLYDPARKPSVWIGLVHAGDYAVFHSDVGTDVEKTSDGRYLQPGEDSVCMVFDSLVEAETYCEAKVEAIPNLRCDIYDHTGKSRPPALTYVNKVHLKTPVRRVY